MSKVYASRGEREFAESPIRYLFFKYSTPTVLGLLLVGVLALIDGAFVGNFVGPEALAALNIVLPVYKLCSALTLILGIGAMTVISTSLGEQDYQKANDALRTAMLVLGGGIVLLSGLLMVFRHDVLEFMGAEDPEVLRLALEYYDWLVPFFPCFALMYFGDFTLKAIGKPYFATGIMALVVGLNIFLDYVFVVEWGLGMKGAAIATSIAYGFGAVIIGMKLLSRGSVVSHRRGGRFRLDLLKQMAYNGSSEGVSDMSSGVAMFLFNKAMIMYFGTMGVTALTSINYIQFLGIIIFLGISDGIVPVISYNFGARYRSRIIGIVRCAFVANFSIGFMFFVVFHFWGRELTGLMFDTAVVSEELMRMAEYGAKIWAFAFIFNGTNILISAYFTAISSPGKSVLISALRGLIFLSACILFIPDLFGAEYIWYSVPVAEFLTLLVSVPLFFKCSPRL